MNPLFSQVGVKLGVNSDLSRHLAAYSEGQKAKSVAKSGAEGESRTHTGISAQRFLSSYPLVYQRLHTITNVHDLARHQEWSNVRGLQGSLRGYQRISKLTGGQSGGQILGMICSYHVLLSTKKRGLLCPQS